MKTPWSRPTMPEHEYGSVPYHQYYAGFYRRNAWAYLPILAIAGFMLLFVWVPDWWNKPFALFYMLMVFWCGDKWRGAKTEALKHRSLAWQKEAQETLTGMMSAGLFETPIEALETMRDGPPPPGLKAAEWVQYTNEIIERVKADFPDSGSAA